MQIQIPPNLTLIQQPLNNMSPSAEKRTLSLHCRRGTPAFGSNKYVQAAEHVRLCRRVPKRFQQLTLDLAPTPSNRD